MNTPPTIQGKELRPLNRFIWARLCDFLTEEKSRGRSRSFILIYGYATFAMIDKSQVQKVMKSDDDFFDAMTEHSFEMSEDDENAIGEYVQGVVNRWEAAQVVTEDTGKQ